MILQHINGSEWIQNECRNCCRNRYESKGSTVAIHAWAGMNLRMDVGIDVGMEVGMGMSLRKNGVAIHEWALIKVRMDVRMDVGMNVGMDMNQCKNGSPSCEWVGMDTLLQEWKCSSGMGMNDSCPFLHIGSSFLPIPRLQLAFPPIPTHFLHS